MGSLDFPLIAALVWVVGVGCWCGLLVCLWTVCGGTCGWDRLVLVVGVDSKCPSLLGLLVWTLVWVGGVGCWCGLLVWAVRGRLR